MHKTNEGQPTHRLNIDNCRKGRNYKESALYEVGSMSSGSSISLNDFSAESPIPMSKHRTTLLTGYLIDPSKLKNNPLTGLMPIASHTEFVPKESSGRKITRRKKTVSIQRQINMT